MSLRPFVVAVEPEHMTRLKAAVSAARSAELDWLKEARTAEGTMYLRGRALSEALARIRVERATLRAKGKLAGTRDLVLAREVRAELRSRAMLGPYEPVPEEDASAPGRRVGTGPHHYGRMFGEEPTTLTERMAVRLPADLGEQLVRSCYWVSAPAVEALLEWQQLWGDGPTVIMREAQRRGGATLLDMLCAAFAKRPTADAILEKSQLQEQIVTTGDIFRSAIRRLPEPPPDQPDD